MTRDSDGDGIPDVDELNKYHTNPNSRDTDNDGLTDYHEVFVYHTDPLKPDPNVKYALDSGLEKYIDTIKPLDNDGIQDINERQFVELMSNSKKVLDIPTFINYLKEKASDGRITDEELKHSNNFASLVNRLYDEIYNLKNLYENNPQLKIEDPMKTIDYSSGLGLKLGFDKELAKDATAKAIGYYGIAVVDRKLPENFDEISLLTKATQIDNYGDKLVDFSPIVFHSVDGTNFVLIPDAGRETWMLAKHMKLIIDSGFDITQHPEMFEGLCGKIIANAYSIWGAKYGINYIEQTLNNRTLKPTDKDVWDVIMLQWSSHFYKTPQGGGGNKLYNRDFPWYKSDELDVLYQDANTRRQALVGLFYLDNGTFDMEKGKRVFGIEGAKTALIQAEKEYEIISRLYPSGKVILPYTGIPADPRAMYYDLVNDRGFHGLWNTHIQLLGMDPQTLLDIIRNYPYEFWDNPQKYVENFNGVDQYITKIWKWWDLVKFVMGYERWAKGGSVKGMDEMDTINYTIPQTLKAFGFPVVNVHIEPTPLGASPYEGAVTLPDYIVNNLKNTFGGKILIGPGNIFGLYLCKEGLEKDGIKEIYIWLGNDNNIYLMKK